MVLLYPGFRASLLCCRSEIAAFQCYGLWRMPTGVGHTSTVLISTVSCTISSHNDIHKLRAQVAEIRGLCHPAPSGAGPFSLLVSGAYLITALSFDLLRVLYPCFAAALLIALGPPHPRKKDSI